MTHTEKKTANQPTGLIAILKKTARYWPLIVLVSIAVSYCIIVLLSRNSYSQYAVTRLAWAFLITPLFYIVIAVFVNRILLPGILRLSKSQIWGLILLSLLISAILAWLVPAPLPVLYSQHTLQIITTADRNPDSQASAVEIRPVSFIDGRPISSDQFSFNGDWRVKGSSFVSDGSIPSSTAILQGKMPGGVVLQFRYKNDAGKVTVQWDGKQELYDLYSKQTALGAIPITSSGWAGVSLWAQILFLASTVLFILGIVCVVFAICFLFQTKVLSRRAFRIILPIAYLAVFVVFLQLKLSYKAFNGERVFNDTTSYVRIAGVPLNSLGFWAGERSFTLPLLYKSLGIDENNYTLKDNLSRVGDVQTWLSIVCWTVLGFALAGQVRRRWLGPLAFAMVLFFSLGVEISLWDRLMLSESISLSMFALMLASWLFLFTLSQRWLRSIIWVIYLILVIFITILYSFARDNNIYFLAASAGVFALILILRKAPPGTGRFILAYTIFLVGLFVVQNLSFELGNRFEYHIFDNLAMRVIENPTAFAYYKAAGLPVSDKLIASAKMSTTDFHDLFFNDPELQPLRDWVVTKGQSTWLKFMITHPVYSILGPIKDGQRALNGGSLEYRYARYPYQPLPPWLKNLDLSIFPRYLLALALILALVIAGAWLFLYGHDTEHPAWLIVFLLVLTIIPLVFIYWNGNPIEIERHANQLGVQYRLAGWISLVLLIDLLALRFYQKINHLAASGESIPADQNLGTLNNPVDNTAGQIGEI